MGQRLVSVSLHTAEYRSAEDIYCGVTDLFVLVGRDGDELRLGERLAADHLLDAADLHDVYPRLVLVQRIQHDLCGKRGERRVNASADDGAEVIHNMWSCFKTTAGILQLLKELKWL